MFFLSVVVISSSSFAQEHCIPLAARFAARPVLSLADIQQRYFGNIEGNEIDPNSLLGQYIAETGAKVSTKAFPLNPNAPELGVERILVPVSEKSLPAFLKYFSDPHFMSVLGHANVLLEGTVHAYGGTVAEFRLPKANTPLPVLMLSDTEAKRLHDYMAAVPKHTDWMSSPLKMPWMLKDYTDVKEGCYQNCTHWIGNIPIGDKLVTEIVVPSSKDQPVTLHLKEPNLPPEHQYMKDIWTFPVHEPLSAVLGLAEKNGNGDFGSPGYVIHTLLGSAPIERVKFVFVVVADHTQAVAADFVPAYEAAR